MKPNDLQISHVYLGVDGWTRKVLDIEGRGTLRTVRYREVWDKPVITGIRHFANWAVEDITPAPTAMVKS